MLFMFFLYTLGYHKGLQFFFYTYMNVSVFERFKNQKEFHGFKLMSLLVISSPFCWPPWKFCYTSTQNPFTYIVFVNVCSHTQKGGRFKFSFIIFFCLLPLLFCKCCQTKISKQQKPLINLCMQDFLPTLISYVHTPTYNV